MQVDILTPCTADQSRSAVATLTSFVLDSDVSVRLCVLMHGSTRSHFRDLDDFLISREVVDENGNAKRFEFMSGHEPKKMTKQAVYARLAEMTSNKLSVLVHPGIVLNDPRWFGKMQQTFLKDPRNMACIAISFENSTLPPLRCNQNQPVHGDIIMGSMDFRAILTNMTGTLEEDIRRNVRGLGGNRWSIASVRYLDTSCQERSEPQATLFE